MLELRSEMGLNTREIAELIGISYTHYNDIENGRRNPSVELSIEMAEFFDVPIEKFLLKRTKFKTGESFRIDAKECGHEDFKTIDVPTTDETITICHDCGKEL
jgi:DNA-binding XRE family transcriptional regulator